MKFSLRAALASLWALILALCLALGLPNRPSGHRDAIGELEEELIKAHASLTKP